jgi:hypothetical protein
VVTHLNSFWKPPISLCRTLPKELLLYTARTLMRSPGEGVLQMPICGGQRSRVSFQRALHTYKNRVHARPLPCRRYDSTVGSAGRAVRR